MHDPVFQSLLLPLLLSALGIAWMRWVAGPEGAAWGGLFGLLGALAWLPGFEWPALARTQKLPWLVLLGLALLMLDTLHRRVAGRPAAVGLATGLAGLLWLLAAVWLAGGRVGAGAIAAAVACGALVLAVTPARGAWDLTHGVGRRVQAAAVLTLASLGLVGLCALGGSLLLAQLALMLAVALGLVAAVSVLRPAWCGPPGPAVLLAFGTGWLALAWTWVLAAPVAQAAGAVDLPRAARVAVLALALGAPLLRWRTARTLLLAAVPLGLALALAWGAGADPTTMPSKADDTDDPYLTR